MSFKNSRRAKSILASLLITSNFVNSKINAMESQSGQSQCQNTYQPQNKPWWQIRGEQAVANEENLLFEGIIIDYIYFDDILKSTTKYCQKVFDTAKQKGIKLLVFPSDEQREKLGIGNGKCYYNKLLTLSDSIQVLGCQIISAHFMKQLTSIFCINALLEHTYIDDAIIVQEGHASVLVPCTDGQLYVLNAFRDPKSDKYYFMICPLLRYAERFMPYDEHTKCGGRTLGLYIRVLLNQITNKYKSSYPSIVKSLIETIDEIDQKGDLLLQPYATTWVVNHKEFGCKPDGCYDDGVPYVKILFSLISDDDRIGDYSKYDMNIWNAAKNISCLEEKEHWENFLKLAEAFPQSKILIACPNVFNPKCGDPVVKLDIKGREAIKNLKADGKVFQKVLSLKEFLDINSEYYPELKKLLKSGNYNFS